MSFKLEIKEAPQEADYLAILAPLIAYNAAQTGSVDSGEIAILIKDDVGNTNGGLYAKVSGQWLFVELLAVPETARGQGMGAKLMGMAETLARKKGCHGIWLDTFSFQAPDFYRKLGFSVFGELENYPIAGHRRFFMQKVFQG